MSSAPKRDFSVQNRSAPWVLGAVTFAIACAGALLIVFASSRHVSAEFSAAPQIARDITKLPAEVQRMRQAIILAATSGDIEQLRVPIDMNEIHPVFTKDRVPDPIAYLKSASGDGNGREMLAILFNLLTTGYAAIHAGTKDEMIVWPYHAVIAPNTLTPSQEVELYRFVTPARFKDMLKQGKYDYYSVGIGRDGVWHYFTAN